MFANIISVFYNISLRIISGSFILMSFFAHFSHLNFNPLKVYYSLTIRKGKKPDFRYANLIDNILYYCLTTIPKHGTLKEEVYQHDAWYSHLFRRT